MDQHSGGAGHGTRRDAAAVYLPAGCDWYDYWTNKRCMGQTIVAEAPIDTLPYL